jgi:hypothetical protein
VAFLAVLLYIDRFFDVDRLHHRLYDIYWFFDVNRLFDGLFDVDWYLDAFLDVHWFLDQRTSRKR